ncbi:MAG: BON domain-containing protein [Pseudomonadota bacterium]
MVSRALVFAAITALPIMAGCAAGVVGAGAAVGVTAAQEKTAGEALDDATASGEIKAKLLRQGGMGEVDVEVAGGLVLLSGRVISPDKRMLAEQIAWSSSRANDVANEIRIEAPGGFWQNASDEIITARVRSRLLGASDVRMANFNVETYGGVVYLLGIARSPEELQRAAEEASYVGGVQQVVSYVRLRDTRGQVVPFTNGAPQRQTTARPGELLGGPGS